MKDFQYTFLTYDPQTPSHISTRLTAYLIDDLSETPTGGTIHYFQRPLATGFYCLILPQHPKRGFIAPVGFSSDGINELELNLKTCGCLNEPTSTSEPLDAEQKRIITDATGGSILAIKTLIEQIRPNYNPDKIALLEWPEIFEIIRADREAKFTARINVLDAVISQQNLAASIQKAANAIQAAQIQQTPPPAKTEPKRKRGRQKDSITPICYKRRIEVFLFVSGKGGRPTGRKDCGYSWESIAKDLDRKYKDISADTVQNDFDIVCKNIDVYFPNGIPKQPEIK